MKSNLIIRMITLFLLLLNVVKLNAQDDEIHTLFNGSKLSVRGFGGPFMNFTTLDNKFAYMMGGGGGIIVNNFLIGGYGVGLANSIPYGTTDDELSFGHGGFWLGYHFLPEKVVHATMNLQLGWGALNTKNRFGDIIERLDKMFILTPGIEAEMNVTRFFRIGLGGFYRIATMVDNNVYSSNDLSGPGINLTFKFGWF